MGDTIDEKNRPIPVPELPPRLLLDLQGGYCNLKCPKCFVHGYAEAEQLKGLRGRMSVENAKKILDEVTSIKPMIQPQLWTEPLMAKDFKAHITQIKNSGATLSLNTNGLLLDDEMAAFLVETKVDAVFISVDATTPDVLLKVRGTEKLDKIEESIFRILKARGENPLPRIGLSFTTEEANEHQLDEFLTKWLDHVDVIRVGHRYNTDGTVNEGGGAAGRVPCRYLYHTMAVHFNGNVSICCLDGYQKAIVGNIFTDGGVKAVWNGEKLTQIRRHHEAGQYDKVPFCKNCDVWAGSTYKDEVRGNLLIRSAPLITYYNRIDRSYNWKDDLSTEKNKASHDAPSPQ